MAEEAKARKETLHPGAWPENTAAARSAEYCDDRFSIS